MNKTFINDFISNLKKSGQVIKISPWTIEGMVSSKAEIRYVGLKLTGDWLDLIPTNTHLLLKFSLIKKEAWVEILLACQPPFQKIISTKLNEADKWEVILGELKRRLKRDKMDFQNHNAKIDSLYGKIMTRL